MKVLITGGRSAQALKLVKAFADDNVLLADYGDMPVFASAAYQMISLGERNDDTIAHNLLNSCLDESVELVLPLHAFEIEALAKSVVLFEEFGIQVLLPEMNHLEKYLITNQVRGKDWAIYQNGTLKFASNVSSDQESIGVLSQKDLGLADHLSGAFYLSTTDQGTQLSLFTIA